MVMYNEDRLYRRRGDGTDLDFLPGYVESDLREVLIIPYCRGYLQISGDKARNFESKIYNIPP